MLRKWRQFFNSNNKSIAYKMCLGFGIQCGFGGKKATTSNTLNKSHSVDSTISHVESWRVVSTWRHFSYPLHNHFKHINTKSHSVDSTISHVESWWVASSHVDLTTFLIPPNNHFKHFNTKSHSDDSTISHVESWRVVSTWHFSYPSTTTSNTLILSHSDDSTISHVD